MPTFANPWYLFLLLALPLVAWWQLRRRRASVPHPSLTLFSGLPVGRARLARYGGLALRLLALALLVLAIAGPRLPDLRTPIKPEGVAVMMVVDVSRSMDEPDFEWGDRPMTRLEAVKKVFRLFIEGSSGEELGDGGTARFGGRETDLVGLVAFASRPEVVCPLTLNKPTLLELLSKQQTRRGAGDAQTNISDAIALAVDRTRTAPSKRKIVVLLTDGEHNVEKTQSGWSPRQAARIAASLGIPVYTIDAGGLDAESQAPGDLEKAEQVRAQAERELKEIASITNGRYFHARDSSALVAACQEIDRLERAPITSYQYRKYHEGYPWFGLAAFSVFVLALVFDRTIWRRLP
jgi:Ca-activated chloride channel family protein